MPEEVIHQPHIRPESSIDECEHLNAGEAQKHIFEIIERVESEAKAASEAELDMLVAEFIELDEALHNVDDRITKMPRVLRDRVLKDIRPYRQQIIARREELFHHEGIKIAFVDELLAKIKEVKTFGALSRVVEGGITLRLITASRNIRGNINFQSVWYIEDIRAAVHLKLKELKEEILKVRDNLSKAAQNKREKAQKNTPTL